MACSPMAAAVQQLTRELDACKLRIKKIEKENDKLRIQLRAAATTASTAGSSDGSTHHVRVITPQSPSDLVVPHRPLVVGSPTTSSVQDISVASAEEVLHRVPQAMSSPQAEPKFPVSPLYHRAQSQHSNHDDQPPLVRFDSFSGNAKPAQHLRSRSYDPLSAAGNFNASVSISGGSVNMSVLRRRIEAFEEREESWREQLAAINKDMEILRRDHRREISGLQEHVVSLTEQLEESQSELARQRQLHRQHNLASSEPANSDVSVTITTPEVDVDRSVQLRKRSKSMVVLKKSPGGPDGQGMLIAELSKADLDEDIFVTHSNHVRTISNNLVPFSAAAASLGSSSKSKNLTSPSAGGLPSGYSITNPNQLGEAVNEHFKSKQWYLQSVLKLALHRVLSNDRDKHRNGGALTDSAGCAASGMHASVSLQGKSMSCIGMMVKELFELHYYIKDNAVVQSDVEVSNLPPFHKQNSDPVLLQNFSSSSTGTTTLESQGTAVDGGDRVFPRLNARSDQIRVVFTGLTLFSYIRSFLHFELDLFLHSIAEATWRESTSPGKSDASMFFFGHFVIKSVKESEYRFLKDSYVGMFARYAEMNPHTLISKFYCLFSVYHLKKGTRQHFVLMNNVFWTRHYINRIFDIKGSSAGRDVDAHVGARTAFGALLLKDNDLPSQLIICGPMKRATLLAQLRSDTSFLASLSIVDYSCIIGIRTRLFTRDQRHQQQLRSQQQQQSLGGGDSSEDQMFSFTAADGGILSLPIYAENDTTTVREDTYYIGLIDVLQVYTAQKRLEHFAKGLLRDKHTISVVPPGEFSERLCKVLERITV